MIGNVLLIWSLSSLLSLSLLIGLDESHFCGDGEMRDWAMNDSFIEFIFEDVLLNGQGLFEIFDRELAHMHNGANVKLVDPMGHFIDS